MVRPTLGYLAWSPFGWIAALTGVGRSEGVASRGAREALLVGERIPHRRREHALVLLLTIVAVLCAGCGSSGGKSGKGSAVDLGGFSVQDRARAQSLLNTLNATNVPATIVQLTATVGLPAVCRVHFATSSDLDVVLAWKPIRRSGDAPTWLTLTIGPDGALPSSLKLGTVADSAELEAHYGVAYTRPFEPCQINAFGWLTAVPLTLAGYPPTGHSLTVPDEGNSQVVNRCALCGNRK